MIDPARLYTSLLNTGLQQKDNPLYQVIHDLIALIVGQQQNITVINSGVISLPWVSFDGTTVFIPFPLALNSDNATLSLGAARDVVLARDVANTLALVNGINPQHFNIYRTSDTGNTNYERAIVGWSLGPGTIFIIGQTQALGTGTQRATRVFADALWSNIGDIVIAPVGIGSWKFKAFGNLFAATDSLYDIGDAAATGRPNSLYLSSLLSVNEAFQANANGLIPKYGNIATVKNGVPSEYATIDTTGLQANVGATTLYAVPASGEGLYRVSAYVVETIVGSVSSTLPNVQVVYTDKDSNVSVTLDVTPILGIAGIGQTGALNANTVGTVASGVVPIYVKASTTIQYQTVNYASNLAGMTYALHIRLEAL